MKKYFLILVMCLLGMNYHSYGQATCDDTNITITGGVNGGTETQHAQNTLQTQSGTSIIIEGNADVTYKAGSNITLNSGFKVEAGSTFKALIETCSATTGEPFVTEWITSSNDESITIPTFPGITYNYEVDWSYDGTVFNAESTGITGDVSKTYDSIGTHTVAIRGEFPRIYFWKLVPARSSSSSYLKIRSVEQWGDIEWSSMERAFVFCLNLDITATDEPDLEFVTSMREMFRSCTSMNGSSLSDWDVSEVTDMNSMFRDAEDFNQSLGSWDVRNVTDMTFMLDGSGLSQSNYEATLNGWASLDSLTPSLTEDIELGADGLEFCDDTGRNVLTNSSGSNWTITGDTDLCSRYLSTGDVAIEEFKMYPNPVENKIILTGLSNMQENYRIQISDLAGRVIFRKENQTEIDVSSLKSGVYFLQILGEEKIVKKFIKL